MSDDLKSRYAALHAEMVRQFERAAVLERHWLIYALLGWECLAACLISHLLLEVYAIQLLWPYVVVWLVQIAVAIPTIKLISGPPQIEVSPIEPMYTRVWVMFVFLCINVAVLNVILGLPVFVMLPALAVVSSSAFTAMAAMISRKFALAGLWMFFTGIAMAYFPCAGFLIYGGSWWLVLDVLAGVFYVEHQPREQLGIEVSGFGGHFFQAAGDLRHVLHGGRRH